MLRTEEHTTEQHSFADTTVTGAAGPNQTQEKPSTKNDTVATHPMGTEKSSMQAKHPKLTKIVTGTNLTLGDLTRDIANSAAGASTAGNGSPTNIAKFAFGKGNKPPVGDDLSQFWTDVGMVAEAATETWCHAWRAGKALLRRKEVIGHGRFGAFIATLP